MTINENTEKENSRSQEEFCQPFPKIAALIFKLRDANFDKSNIDQELAELHYLMVNHKYERYYEIRTLMYVIQEKVNVKFLSKKPNTFGLKHLVESTQEIINIIDRVEKYVKIHDLKALEAIGVLYLIKTQSLPKLWGQAGKDAWGKYKFQKNKTQDSYIKGNLSIENVIFMLAQEITSNDSLTSLQINRLEGYRDELEIHLMIESQSK